MKNLTFVIIYVLLLGVQTSFGQNKTDIIIGSTFTIQSKILNEERTLKLEIKHLNQKMLHEMSLV